MEKFNNKIVAANILNALNKKGANLGNASISIIDNVLNQVFESKDTFELPDCAWGKTHPFAKVGQHLQASSSIGYTNSRHSDCPQDLDEAIEKFSEKFKGNKEYSEYWDNQSEVITKITTITEVVAIIQPEDKK